MPAHVPSRQASLQSRPTAPSHDQATPCSSIHAQVWHQTPTSLRPAHLQTSPFSLSHQLCKHQSICNVCSCMHNSLSPPYCLVRRTTAPLRLCSLSHYVFLPCTEEAHNKHQPVALHTYWLTPSPQANLHSPMVPYLLASPVPTSLLIISNVTFLPWLYKGDEDKGVGVSFEGRLEETKS